MNADVLRAIRESCRSLSATEFPSADELAVQIAARRFLLSGAQERELRRIVQETGAFGETTLRALDDDSILLAAKRAWHPRKHLQLPRFQVRSLYAVTSLSCIDINVHKSSWVSGDSRQERLLLEPFFPSSEHSELKVLDLRPRPLALHRYSIVLLHEPTEFAPADLDAILAQALTTTAKVVFVRDRSAHYWRRIEYRARYIAEQLERAPGVALPVQGIKSSRSIEGRAKWTWGWWHDTTKHPSHRYWRRLAAAAKRRADTLSYATSDDVGFDEAR